MIIDVHFSATSFPYAVSWTTACTRYSLG